MRYFMFGMDREEPEAFAQALAEKGYEAAVCAPQPRQIAALNRAGLAAYLCVGAFPLSDGGDRCVDVAGEERAFFSSACPGDDAAAGRGLARIAALARTEGIRGIYLDGARFASPASAEGTDAFFTCFCAHCRARAVEMGVDLEKAREAMRALQRGEARDFPPELLRLRAGIIADYFARFIDSVHGVNPALEANAFVFAPSLMRLVGQTPQAFSGLDALSPMLYRAYPEKDGPACLNHEYAALLRLFGPETTRRLTGVTPPEAPLTKGFPPQALARETRAARQAFAGRLEPIVQLRDPLLPASIRAVREGGAQGCGFFAYSGGGAAAIPRMEQPNR